VKRDFSQTTRFVIAGLVFLLFFAFLKGYLPNRYLESLDSELYDFRLRSHLLNDVDDRVVILDIDEKSISALGQWPWKRTVLADLIEKLMTDYQIKVIGFDAVFPEPEDTSAQILIAQLEHEPQFKQGDLHQLLQQKKLELDGNSHFAESIIARNVVTGFTFDEYIGSDVEYPSKGMLGEPLIKADSLSQVKLDFHRAGGYVANYEYLSQAASFSGFFNYPREDRSLRKVPLLYQYRGDIYPSLALQTAMVALDTPQLEFLFEERAQALNSLSLEFIKIGNRKIPVDENLSVYVPYRGGNYSFPYISVIDVLTGTTPKETLHNKILLLGTTATGLMDLRATPVSDTYPGVEVHANVISGILDSRFKLKPAYLNSIEMLLLLLLTFLLYSLLPRLGAFGALITFSSAIAAVFALSFYLWQAFNLVIPMANPILLVITLSFLLIVYDYFAESKQKKRMNRMFGQYIPKELVHELDQNSHELSLAGESREMSVLFSDVRGFTTISEGLPPQELTQLMNEFLTPITKAIHDHRGTIDKYMGDAVMAFWGAPLTDEQHANHAVQTAFKMIEAMHQIQPVFADKGWPEIIIGVGISSGEMRVGNMGSEFRMAYTVLGDVVNLGSRLEGLTKNYGVDIIVSDGTAKLADNFIYRELDRVKVKGKNEPVVIFEPLAEKDKLAKTTSERLEKYQQAVSQYHLQNWSVAEKLFKQLAEVADDKIYKIYLQRIELYKNNPPDEKWDGVFVHTTK
jgi:adenylate cyclase